MTETMIDESFVCPENLPLAVEEGYTMPVITALVRFQEHMRGEAERAGFHNDEDVAEWIMSARHMEELS